MEGEVSIGTGIEQVTVVSVVGQDEATAKRTLENLGLTDTISYQTATSDNGKVTAQSIDANRTVDKGSTITLTVNKVAETKSVSVSINVKSITGYTEPTDDNTTTGSTNNRANIEIKVGGETVYTDSNVDKNTTNKTATIQGKGTAIVQLTITDSNGGNWSRTQTINFNSATTINFS